MYTLLLSGAERTRALRRWAGRLLTLVLPLLAALGTQAQSIAAYTFAASSGAFTPLTGATTAPVPSTDDDVTGILPIGFVFAYNGVAYTTFSASTNGAVTLGGQVSAALVNNLTNGGNRPVLAPLWDDLDISATTNISYLTSGTAGSRVMTVQWLNVKWDYGALSPTISFQAKLYEADGHIDFVYRQETGALNSPSASIGITAVATGSGNFLSLSDATAAPTASSTTETTTIAMKPATGQVYSFTPAGTAPAAPSTLVFSALSTTGGTVTFTDNSTNEFNFAVTITPTAGGASTTTIVPSTTTAGTGTTYSTTFTGLMASTGYTVQVVALGQGRVSAAGTGTFSTTTGVTLSGIYYVGTSTSPNPTRTYATLTAAAAAYSTGTLTGAVTFLLLDNAYGAAETFPIRFGANTSASATNTLTISPNTGVANATITASSTSAGLVLNGAKYVIINGSNTTGGTTRNLTVATTSTTGTAAIQLISLGVGAGATNDVIRNVNLAGPSSNAGFGIMVGGATLGSPGADNDNLTIQNNSIRSCYSGISVLGTAAVSTGGTDGLVIMGNTLGATTSGTGSLGNVGILVNNAVSPSLTLNTVQNILGAGTPAGFSLAGATGATIGQNTVQNVGSSGNNAFGIVLGTGSTGATVTRNRMLNIYSSSPNGYGGKGIDVATGSATSNVLIANNFIQVTASSGYTFSSDANIGIRLGTGTALGGVNVYYNSVNLTGTDIYATAVTQSAALYVGSASTALNIRNNIFRNTIVNSANTGAKAYAFYSAAANTAFTQLNYNDYFVSGAQGVLGYCGADATTLAALQTATGKDQNSLNVDPLFATTTDLHTNSAALDNVATPIATITDDIDGDVRSTTTPDIGADEFTPINIDIAAAGLVAPAVPGSTGACFGSAEAVTVSIRNAGAAALNFATTPATITVVVTGPIATQTLSFVLSTGTLASGATLSVPLTGAGTTVNLSTVGTYSFAITATVTGDGNTANDVLTPSPTITVAAPVAGTLAATATSICNSGTIVLTLSGFRNGAIQLQSGTSATGPFTNVTGATSATYTTPVLTSMTFYRARVTCGATVVTSNVVTVTVSSPAVATTNTPVAICSGTATLTATANTGSNIRFFSAATGGTALATATPGSYTTPALTANTTYYAEAFTGNQENVGKPSTTGADGPNGIGGLFFTATAATTIASVTVYRAANTVAGTATIQLFTGSTTAGMPVATVTVPVPANTTAAVSPTVLTLNLAVPAAGQYTLYLSAVTTSLMRDTPGGTSTPTTAYPYTSPSGVVSITNGTIPGYYYFFYNWQVVGQCVGATRTAIQVTVNPAANAAFNYGSTSSFCTSATTAVAPTLATGATAGTFSSTTGLTINATTGAITPSTSTAGTYTVTNRVAASGGCATTSATATVTINPLPATPTVGVTYPTGSTALLTSSAAPAGATYQWFLNGVAIAGATGQTYTANGATAPGAYTVRLTFTATGCQSAASTTTTVTATAQPLAGTSLRLFPNPTSDGQVTLQLSGYTKAVRLTVLDVLGRVVLTQLVAAGQTQARLDLSGTATGVYLLRATTEGGTDMRRFVRE